MTIAVDLGRKATKQTNKQINSFVEIKLRGHIAFGLSILSVMHTLFAGYHKQ